MEENFSYYEQPLNEANSGSGKALCPTVYQFVTHILHNSKSADVLAEAKNLGIGPL